ncbi:MAG: HTTM domain-containing protein [Planctomycetes bacterium]|nr:HTTM domain-containing protein [Planctomycetota bacterium]
MKTAPSTPVEGGNVLTALAQRWDRFWFSPGDPKLLGLIRLLCGLVVLYVHLAYTADLKELMGPHAWVDHQTVNEFRHGYRWFTLPWGWEEAPNPAPFDTGYYAWSIWYHVTNPGTMMAIHITILVIMFLFTIGFCTRITSVLTWLAAVSYIQRSPTSLFGMDTMMNLLLLYLMIGPSGAAFSVDRLIARYWGTWRALRGHRPAPAAFPHPQLVSANLALRLIQVNLCFIYLAAGLAKLQGTSWWSGTAIYRTLANPEFSPMQNGLYAAFLIFLCRHRGLWELLMTGGVLFTFAVEIGFPFLIWNPRTRWTMITGAFLMHTGIALSMGLTTFSMMMVLMVFSFIPQEILERLLDAVAERLEHLRLALYSRARGQVRAASVVRAFDVWDQVSLQETGLNLPGAGSPRSRLPGDNQHLQLVTNQGQVLAGYDLFQHLARKLPLWWPLGLVTFIPGVAQVGRNFFPGTAKGEDFPAPPRESERRPAKEEQVTR